MDKQQIEVFQHDLQLYLAFLRGLTVSGVDKAKVLIKLESFLSDLHNQATSKLVDISSKEQSQ